MQRFSMIATEVINRVIGLSAIPGERLDVSPVQASVLTRKRLARFATKADEAPPEPEPIPEPDPEPIAATRPVRRRRSRRYKTRDMAAE